MSAGGGKSESQQTSVSAGGSQSQSLSGGFSGGQSQSFVDQQQQPFLQDLRSQGQAFTAQQQAPGSATQQNIGAANQAFQNFLTPQQNPFLQGQIQQGQQQIAENFTENLLPQIGGAAAAVGQRGGGRQGVAEGVALRDASRQSSDFAQNLLSADFQGQQNRALGALGQANQVNQLAFQPLQNLQQIIGGPTVLNQSQNFARDFAEALSSSFATSNAQGTSSSKQASFGF